MVYEMSIPLTLDVAYPRQGAIEAISKPMKKKPKARQPQPPDGIPG